MSRYHWFLTPMLALALAGSASAGIVTLDGALRGSNEVPPSGSAGTGLAVVSFDTILNTLTIDVTFSGLTGTTTASHIHCCASFGTNAGVATTTPTFAGFPLGVTSGTFHTVLDLTQSSSYNPSFITANGGTTTTAEAALLAGFQGYQSYLNIHTNVFPGGEIRANLAPEPASTMLLAMGLAGLVVRKRLFSRR